MFRKIALAAGVIAATAGMIVVSAPAQARPMVCHRVFDHGHPHRVCHPAPPPHHGPYH